MKFSESVKVQYRRLAKSTWLGPGKFGVFILICIFVIATMEKIGLSNREKVIESRFSTTLSESIKPFSVNQKDMPVRTSESIKELKLTTKKQRKDKIDQLLREAVLQQMANEAKPDYSKGEENFRLALRIEDF